MIINLSDKILVILVLTPFALILIFLGLFIQISLLLRLAY